MSASSRRVLLARSARLDPELASAGRARKLLRAALAETDRQEWIDSAELAIGEVVANAVLHAHTAIEVSLEVRVESVHVEVQDFNAAMPMPREADEQATTGRGMALVAALSTGCGIRNLGPDGKVVWFEVGERSDHSADDDLLEAWGSWETWEDWEDPATEPGDSMLVQLQGLPPTLWAAARQHHDAMLRELVLYLAEHEEEKARLDLPLADAARGVVTAALKEHLDGRTGSGERSALAGPHVPAGTPPVDLEVRMSRSLAPAYAALQETLDLAERLAVQGRLLVRPGLPEIVDVRDWVCDQVVQQAAGTAPQAWLGTAQRRFETMTHDRATLDPPKWDALLVRESDRGVAAADDANRIVAVSRSLAALLGWEVDELVGRRVVTIVPPELREAHVAGFSRHLNTGQAHALGVPMEVPVLRRDGDRVQCRLLIEEAPTHAGRSVYLAWIQPLT
jgi:PAS domain S-box-containing protein